MDKGPITVGVLALQGGVDEHLSLLRRAAPLVTTTPSSPPDGLWSFTRVCTADELSRCDALIIPGGESTTMSIVAKSLGLLEPLREFVKVQQRPTWGTCAGLVLLAEEASAVKRGGQDLIGGLDVRVARNRYGTQIQSFVADLRLPFLRKDDDDDGSTIGLGARQEAAPPFRGVFIRAPVVEAVNIGRPEPKEDGEEGGNCCGGDVSNGVEMMKKNKKKVADKGPVEVMGVYSRKINNTAATGEEEADEDIVAVRQGNVFGTSFHPELTSDVRIHVWWLKQVLDELKPLREK